MTAWTHGCLLGTGTENRNFWEQPYKDTLATKPVVNNNLNLYFWICICFVMCGGNTR
jgi:hypothetical protein